MMAADSAGGTVTTVVTCAGDLNSPNFRAEFDAVLGQLEGLLGEQCTVRKLEPWNSVRVTLSIPREAALRLRQLANDGNQRLRALGILSVQVEGDQVISLRLAGTGTSEPQEIVLRTNSQDGAITSQDNGNLSQLLSNNTTSGSSGSSASSSTGSASNDAVVAHEKVQFRSPNVVCPSDSIVPKVPVQSATNNATLQPSSAKGASYPGPFPFTSMNQAMHTNRDTSTNNNGNSYATATPAVAVAMATPAPSLATGGSAAATASSYTSPPPPYPGKHPPVTLCSPLLVNLLQNEGVSATTTTTRIDDALASGGVSTTTLPVQTTVVNHLHQRQLHKVLPVRVNNVHGCGSAMQSAATCSNNNKVVLPTYATNANMHQMQHQQQKQQVGKPIARNPVPYNSYPPPYPNTSTITATTMTPQQQTPATMQQFQLQPQTSSAMMQHNNRWEQSVQQMPQLQDLTATLTDFKQTDLDLLLPNLTASPSLDIPYELHSENRTVLLINPLTGELEPQIGTESDDEIHDVFTGLPMSPIHFSDEDTNSTIRPDTTDQSDSESRSGHSDSSKHSKAKARTREKGRDSPSINKAPTEKIKLRLKLEKSEPVNTVYKADVSFINTQQPKKAMTNNVASTVPGEEPRVPPLHISLRGRHVVINNKKKIKLAAEGVTVVKSKPKKIFEYNKLKRERGVLDPASPDDRKLKVPKLNDKLVTEAESTELIYNNHIQFHKDKLKERRGSDSELTRNNKKYVETNGTERRLSQSDDGFDPEIVLGSTNVGTVTSFNKIRNKDKFKVKENFKSKDLNRFKSYSINIAEKMNKQQQIALPTNEIDMEARFKERLLKIEDVQQRVAAPDEKVEELIQTLEDQPTHVKDKPPEPDKCNTPDRTSKDLQDKQQPNRSPNSGAQGEDSGIESMDALSEKSPNQASQSPHEEIMADAKNHKTQVPDMLDIEAQLAKMEGMHADEADGEPEPDADGEQEDLNENHRGQTKLDQCCVLTSSLKDNIGNPNSLASPTNTTRPMTGKTPPSEDASCLGSSAKTLSSKDKDEQLEPLPLRVTPPLYTYSNPEKRGNDSPTLPDAENNPNNPVRKSLLEQLLIDIPENQTPSSPSPATRSVRTRASSKLNSPELSSPVVSSNSCTNNANNKLRTTPTAKRKRHESDSSSNSLDTEQRNKKPRKCSENAIELIKSMDSNSKPALANTALTANNATIGKKKVLEESSDSDEPLIEVAGKVRKNTANATVTRVVKLKTNNSCNNVNVNAVTTPSTQTSPGGKGSVNTRRSIRTLPVINTRSKGDKSNPEGDVIRRKTRSAVSEGEGKRRKDIK